MESRRVCAPAVRIDFGNGSLHRSEGFARPSRGQGHRRCPQPPAGQLHSSTRRHGRGHRNHHHRETRKAGAAECATVISFLPCPRPISRLREPTKMSSSSRTLIPTTCRQRRRRPASCGRLPGRPRRWGHRYADGNRTESKYKNLSTAPQGPLSVAFFHSQFASLHGNPSTWGNCTSCPLIHRQLRVRVTIPRVAHGFPLAHAAVGSGFHV